MGMGVLIGLLILMAVIYAALPYFIHKSPPEKDELFAAEVEKYLSAQISREEPKVLTPFPFDPNTISAEQLIKMGLTDYQASMIIKYRNAGGRFSKKEDFARIYSLTDEAYQTLAPFIVIAQPAANEKAESRNVKTVYQPFPFDPNEVDSVELAAMGLGTSQIKNIMNYRNAGGTFRKKSDFKKLYTIDDELYAVFEKNILLPSVDSVDSTLEEVKNLEAEIVEINGADTAQLKKLKGIGPVLAQRIVDYRQKLGGFYDKVQLLEVFGIDTARFNGFAGQVEVDRSKIVKTDINTAGFSDLLKNPYVEYYIVQSIFGYKDAIGRFDSVGQLREIELIYDQLYQKLEPYFIVENISELN
jgi:DNA uptake protein ComE-like DNA-binding protein